MNKKLRIDSVTYIHKSISHLVACDEGRTDLNTMTGELFVFPLADGLLTFDSQGWCFIEFSGSPEEGFSDNVCPALFLMNDGCSPYI